MDAGGRYSLWSRWTFTRLPGCLPRAGNGKSVETMVRGSGSKGAGGVGPARASRTKRCAAWLAGFLVAASLAACAPAPIQSGASGSGTDSAAPSVAPRQSSQRVPAIDLFAASGEVSELGNDWEPWILHPSKRRTSYRWSRDGEGVIVTATAEAAASGLSRPLDVDPASHPMLEWRWQVDALIPGADNTDPHGEDAPVRVVLDFEGNRAALPVRDRLFFEQMRLLTGRELPYATLMYIWENSQPSETVLRNPHTSRVRKLVVSSGTGELGRWVRFRRNIVEDYRRAFGAEPGRLVGIAILTDTDNTGEKTRGRYGNLRLSPHELRAAAR